MKSKLFFLCLISFLTFCGCNKDKIILEILSPTEYEEFAINEQIDIKVSASTEKGRILQVVITVDTLITESFTAPPYEYSIPPYTFPEKDHLYSIAVMAYSSEGVQEGNGLYIKIKK